MSDSQSAWRGQLLLAFGYNVVLWSLVALAAFSPAPVETAVGIIGFFLGAALGSWLNQVAYRLWHRLPLDDPPSSCPRCRTPIRRFHNVPLLGYLLLRGRCAACGLPISWVYPAVELTSGVLLAGLGILLVRLSG